MVASLSNDLIHLLNEATDGARGGTVLADSREIMSRQPGTDIEGGNIVRDGRSILQKDLPLLCVYAHRLRDYQAGAGQSCQSPHIDLQFLLSVLAGHETGNHSRIDGDWGIDHQREPAAGRGLGGELLKDLNMRMAAAHQYDFSKLTGLHVWGRHRFI